MFNNSDMRRLGESARGVPSATTSIENRLRAMREEAGTQHRTDLTLTVQRQVPVAEGVARVLLQTGGTLTERNLEAAMAETFGHKVRYMGGSAHVPDEENPSLVMAFVNLNQPSKAYDEATLRREGWKSVTANVFADPGDQTIWRVVGDGDARMLVQDSDDNLASLLSTRGSRSVTTASMELSFSEGYKPGDGIAWYDTHDEAMRYGIAVSTAAVFDFETQAIVPVAEVAALVVKEADDGVGRQVTVQQTETAFDGEVLKMAAPNAEREPLSKDNMIERHLSYMRTLYKSNSDYFERLQSLLKDTFRSATVPN